MMAARHTEQNSVLLSELLQGIADISAVEDRSVQGVTADSRRVQKGDLFLACEGLLLRGHDYIASAVERGATAVAYEVAEGEVTFAAAQVGEVPLLAVRKLSQQAGVIAERFYGHPSRDMFVVGITGTNGKTSCGQFLAQALSEEDHPCGIIGTLGNGLVDHLTPSTHTTPDAVTLHSLLADLRDAGARSVAMEVSSHALDQGRVVGVRFSAALFTNLSRDHLDYHGDMAAYGAAKQRLFHSAELQFAAINGDDSFGREILANLRPEVKAVSYGLGEAVAANIPHLHGTGLHLNHDGLTMTLTGPWGEGQLRSSLLGRFNASNLLAVAAMLLVKGMSLPEVLQRLEALRPVSGRMECFGGDGKQPLVVVDYAHTPDALEQALIALREHCTGHLWCVFGCGGDRDTGKRPLMGEVAVRLADRVIITDDNPRSEEPARIVADILAGIADQQTVSVIHDRDAAIASAVSQADGADVVLVAGKGHETTQQVGMNKLPFRDQDAVRRHLAGVQS